MSNNVLPPYPGGANPVSSLSTGTGPNIGTSSDHHPSTGGSVYPFPYLKGGSGCAAKWGGCGCGAKWGGKSKKTRSRSKKGGKWSLKYKRSINCRRPKGFSQRQHCKYGRGRSGKTARRS